MHGTISVDCTVQPVMPKSECI